MKFKVYEDKSGQWRWRIVASNGRIVADSAEGYVSKGNAERAVAMVRKGLETRCGSTSADS